MAALDITGSITDFKTVPSPIIVDDTEQMIFTAEGADFSYRIKKRSLRHRPDGIWVVKFAQEKVIMHLHITFLAHNMVSLWTVLYNDNALQRSLFKMSESAKSKLLNYLDPIPDRPVVKVKIPKGQEDAIYFAEIPNGTLMVDFHKERDEFHRYFTKEVFDAAIKPKMKSPFTNKVIKPEELTYYIAELDATQTPYPTQQGGRRRLATGKTRRVKSRRTRKRTL